MEVFELFTLVLTTFSTFELVESAAEAGIKLKGDCGTGALGYLGVEKNKFKRFMKRRAIIFDHDKIEVVPRKPKIPGCFNLTAKDVQIRKYLPTITAEFHMNIGGDYPNYADEEKLPCKKKNEAQCACGAKDACMYCDFCTNFHEDLPGQLEQYDSAGRLIRQQIRKSVDVQRADRSEPEDTCKCNIEPGIYNFNAEICTPERSQLEKVIPADVFAFADSNFAFTLWTTLYVYTSRFNDINPHSHIHLSFLKRTHLGGCAIIGTDLSFE